MAAFTFNSLTIKRYLAQVFPASFPATVTHNAGNTTTLNVAIGEHLFFTHAITANVDLRGKTIHFAPSMFAPINNTVGLWWEFIIPTNGAGGTLVTGTLLSQLMSLRNMGINLRLVSVGTTTVFTIEMDTYATMETNGFPISQSFSNHERFLKNSDLNPYELENSDYGDYFHSDGVAAGNGIYYWALEALDQYNASLIPYVEQPSGSITVKGKFYEVDFDNAASTITTPVWSLFSENASQVYDNLSSLENVLVKFKATFPAAPITDSGVVYIIKSNAQNDAVDFLQNYETGEARITTNAGSSVINAGIKQPSVTWTSLGAGVYQLQFHIDKTHLVSGGLYRMIAICYSSNGAICSFISDEYMVNEIPTCTDIETDYGIKDLVGHSGTDISTSVQDRLMVYCKGNYADTQTYIAAVIAKTDPSLIITPQMVKLEIYTEETLIPGNSIFKQVYETQTLNFQSWVYDSGNSRFYASYGAPANLVWGFINQEDMFFSSDGLTMTEWNNILYHFRARYESNILNIADYLNGIQQPLPTSDQDWGGRTLLVTLTVKMNYSFTKDSIPYAYCDQREFQFRITIERFQNDLSFVRLSDPTITDADGNPVIDICALDEVKMTTTSTPALPDTGVLIGLIDKASFGITNLKEEDSFVIDTDFPELSAPPLDPTPGWVADIGSMLIDLTALDQAGVYRASIIYKQPA